TAEFHEREVYEMFGVNFLNHPDLRLLILPDGWEGKNPLRKDFEDPINMIRL
ncbi:MAG TPA: NADH-quinone oxidoreductase chain 5, partial [Chitinophagaceae bacterium]|nr:NADH-quinone oxidoreductase chain 5 [Chitinophagaceae bacterium]